MTGQAKSEQGSFEWTDVDGDIGRLTTEEVPHDALASLEITDGANRSEHAVYVTPDNAREIIAWLERRI